MYVAATQNRSKISLNSVFPGETTVCQELPSTPCPQAAREGCVLVQAEEDGDLRHFGLHRKIHLSPAAAGESLPQSCYSTMCIYHEDVSNICLHLIVEVGWRGGWGGGKPPLITVFACVSFFQHQMKEQMARHNLQPRMGVAGQY